MGEYLYDNTIVRAASRYTLERGKRRYLYRDSSLPNVVDGSRPSIFSFEAYMRPPLHLLPKTWVRYNYTPKDVRSTFDKADASYVWQISMMFMCGQDSQEAVTTGVRSTFQSSFSFLFISRRTVFESFMATQLHHVKKNTTSVLCRERPDHRPLLPKVYVNETVFSELCKFVPSRHPSFRWVVRYHSSYRFKDIHLVPVQFDKTNTLIYMVRAIKKSTMDSIPFKPKKCLITMPTIVEIDGVPHVLTEEACFFAIDPRNNFNTDAVSDTGKKRTRSATAREKNATSKKKRVCSQVR